MSLPYATEAQLRQLVNKLGSRISEIENKLTLLTQTSTEEAASFMSELSENSISNYLVENSEAIMNAFGVSKEDSAVNIGTAIYNKLQGGETISVTLNDEGVLKISGHFDENPDSPNLDTWNIKIIYEIPKKGTSKCFEKGSNYVVKSGTVTLIANPAEITNTLKYDIALCVYSYSVDLDNVVINNSMKDYIINIKGLTKKEDRDNPCIIDPNGATFTITLHDFKLPEDNAVGTIQIDGEEVNWKDVKALVK